jgi:hypothetical protein
MKRLTQLVLWLALATPAFLTPAAQAAAGGFTLLPGESLKPGEFLQSPNKKYLLVLQQDGNLALNSIEASQLLWSSNTAGLAVSQAIMQTDGNFVIYGFPDALWSTNTGGDPGAYLILQDDGNLVVYQPVWNSGTGR